MTEIKISIKDSVAVAEVLGTLTARARGVPVWFELGQEYAGLTPKMAARAGDRIVEMVMFGGRSEVPHECMIAGQWLEIGVRAISREGTVILPTVWAGCGRVAESPGELETPEPTMKLADQILVAAGEAVEKSTDALEKATEALDAVAYVDDLRDEINYLHPLNMTAYNLSPSIAQKGDTVQAVTITFAANRKNVKFTYGGAEVASGLRVEGPFRADIAFPIKAELGNTAVEASGTLQFVSPIWYGAARNIEDGTGLSVLTKKLQGNRRTTFTVNCEEGKHIFFAVPVSYGTPVFNVGGFEGGFMRTYRIKNTEYGYEETYDLWMSVNTGLGNTAVTVT